MCGEPVEKLKIEAQICISCGAVQPTAVSRGMAVCGQDGEICGEVAAVVVNGRSAEATHLIISCQMPDYHLVPIDYISAVTRHKVLLQLTAQQLKQLPLHIPKP